MRLEAEGRLGLKFLCIDQHHEEDLRSGLSVPYGAVKKELGLQTITMTTLSLLHLFSTEPELNVLYSCFCKTRLLSTIAKCYSLSDFIPIFPIHHGNREPSAPMFSPTPSHLYHWVKESQSIQENFSVRSIISCIIDCLSTSDSHIAVIIIELNCPVNFQHSRIFWTYSNKIEMEEPYTQ